MVRLLTAHWSTGSVHTDNRSNTGRKDALMPFDDTMPAAPDGLRLRFVAESELSTDDHAAISALLVAAFPEHADAFRNASWYGGRPDHRLWLEDSDGTLMAHLDFECRLIGVGDREVLVAGVGEVATHPQQQGRGLGRRLMAELRRVLTAETPVGFGYLGCREEVVGFYERVGWHRIYQKTREIDPGSREWTVSAGDLAMEGSHMPVAPLLAIAAREVHEKPWPIPSSRLAHQSKQTRPTIARRIPGAGPGRNDVLAHREFRDSARR